jgi:intracellular sulfur oxidation DsrE/DsrF family protein
MTFFLKPSPVFTTTVFFVLFCNYSFAQEWQTPLIEGYGKIKYVDKAAELPNPVQEYKLLFDVTSDNQKNGVNKRLWVVARTLNMLHISGVPSSNIKIVVAIHGAATFNILTEEAHVNRFGKSNPNIDLIQKLRANGVSLFVCSQATATRNIKDEEVHIDVVPAFSALSVLANYQIQGYHLMPK